MASIVCPGCQIAVPVDDVDLGTRLAKCRRCQSVFDFRDQVRTPQEDARRRRELAPPSGFRVTERATARGATSERAGYRDSAADKPAIEITHVWRSWRTVPMVLGAVVAGFWSLGVATAIARSHAPGVANIALGALFMLPGVVASAAALYGLVNRTRIIIDDAHVRVEHWPLPWLGAGTAPSGEVRTLYVAQHRSWIHNASAPPTFDVLADTKSDPRRVLVRALPGLDAARFVARHIADRLGAPDPD
jgi:hypothetical protein